MLMSDNEFQRRRFKIQDNAIRSILNLLNSDSFDPTVRLETKKTLTAYEGDLKKLYDEVESRRYD